MISVPIKIDAHHHFWKYDPTEYGWIDESMKAIRRDFLPADLNGEIGSSGIDGVVSVQARQSLEETGWLLELADLNPIIRGVVGWVPLIDPGVAGILEKLAWQPKLKGVRHVLQGEPDDGYMLGRDFQAGISGLRRFGLAYDILIYERQLPQAIGLVDHNPNQVFVLDHIAKPRIRDRALSRWRQNIRKLAERPNVYCKISGMVTEADYEAWSEADLQPYFETVLEAFGPGRLMFGSDWPVCLVACTYRRWVETVARALGKLSPSEQEMVWGGTARAAYKI